MQAHEPGQARVTKNLAALALLLLGAAGCAVDRPPATWQQEVAQASRAAAQGSNTALTVRPGSPLAANWAPGVYVFYNAPRPFCYRYSVPGEWLPVAGGAGMLRAKDGDAVVNVTFVPPAKLERIEGASLLERGRNSAVRELERALHQSLADVSFVPFESARPGAWRLSAAPVSGPDGRKAPLPLYVIVDMSPHTVAEINVMNSGRDEELARRILDGLKTTSDPACYAAELERMLKAAYAAP